MPCVFIGMHFDHAFQAYGGGLAEPSIDYQLESSRGSDLSDILEEEEEDLYSESIAEVQGRGYSTAATGRVSTHATLS